MGCGHFPAALAPPHLEHYHRHCALAGYPERLREGDGVANTLEVAGDDSGIGVVDQETQIVGRAYRRLAAARDRVAEAHSALVLHHRVEDGAGCGRSTPLRPPAGRRQWESPISRARRAGCKSPWRSARTPPCRGCGSTPGCVPAVRGCGRAPRWDRRTPPPPERRSAPPLPAPRGGAGWRPRAPRSRESGAERRGTGSTAARRWSRGAGLSAAPRPGTRARPGSP